MELDSGFKERLRWAINLKETSQSALARHLGTSPQAVQQWAAGATQNPRRDHVKLAAEFLGCRYEWLAYGRGPMKAVPLESVIPPGGHAKNTGNGHTETALLSHEWEEALRSSLPEAEAKKHWQVRLQHPSGSAAMRVGWLSDQVIAEVGLYRLSASMIHSARQHLWLLAVVRESLPVIPGRRTVLILAPLEQWLDTPHRHISALRAEARTMGIEVIHVNTPEHAAAVLLGREESLAVPNGEDLGLDISPVL